MSEKLDDFAFPKAQPANESTKVEGRRPRLFSLPGTCLEPRVELSRSLEMFLGKLCHSGAFQPEADHPNGKADRRGLMSSQSILSESSAVVTSDFHILYSTFGLRHSPEQYTASKCKPTPSPLRPTQS